jgi:hypothetical protein
VDQVSKEKSAATEKLAVLEAEYRTYKAVCNTPTKLADQLNKLVSLEADRASVQVRKKSPAWGQSDRLGASEPY